MSKYKNNYTVVFLAILTIIGIVWLSKSLHSNEFVVELINEFGHLAVVAIGIVGGLNTFVPVPAATFSPIFIEAGIGFYTVVILLAIGTLIADFIGYLLGSASRNLVASKYPKVSQFFLSIRRNRERLLLPMVFLYAALVPFPNEVILIPLALTGLRFRYLVLPLMLGNTINQAVLSFGFSSAFDLFI